MHAEGVFDCESGSAEWPELGEEHRYVEVRADLTRAGVAFECVQRLAKVQVLGHRAVAAFGGLAKVDGVGEDA